MRIHWWQIMLFSLVPLALVFMGVIGGSFHGVDSAKEPTPTAAPRTAAGGGGTAPPPPPGSVVIQIVARGNLFNTRSLSAPPNTQVTVRMDHQDPGVLHNFALYRDSAYRNSIFVGQLHTGPGTFNDTFTTPNAGTYYFRCDVHPDTMNGSFLVR